jgi:hypothetical protein
MLKLFVEFYIKLSNHIVFFYNLTNFNFIISLKIFFIDNIYARKNTSMLVIEKQSILLCFFFWWFVIIFIMAELIIIISYHFTSLPRVEFTYF